MEKGIFRHGSTPILQGIRTEMVGVGFTPTQTGAQALRSMPVFNFPLANNCWMLVFHPQMLSPKALTRIKLTRWPQYNP